MTAATAWFLLTIVGNTVNPSHGFPDRHLCEEGKSLFLYGQSIEDRADADAKAEARRKADDAAFYAKYKPRPPKDAQERKAVQDAKNGILTMGLGGFSSCAENSVAWAAYPDGLMHPYRDSCAVMTSGMYEPRSAYCVPDDQDKTP